MTDDKGLAGATLAYVNVFVTDFAQALAFYRDALGLTVVTADENFGYASFAAGAAQGATLAFACVGEDQSSLAGRHTGIGWMVSDVDASYRSLEGRGVQFESPPAQQPWGGYMAIFKDPDGNLFYLDQAPGV